VEPVAYPLQQLGELYLHRWSVELRLREIKIAPGMDVLRCQTPAMVTKEVTMHAVSYNLVRSLMPPGTRGPTRRNANPTTTIS
jgi:hypothetical protein